MPTPQHNISLSIPGSAGNLEARLRYTIQSEETGVIICPPHPLLAGNMENNVIQVLAERISPFFPVLTFNYQGVGKSSSPNPDLPLFELWDRLDKSEDYSTIIDDGNTVCAWSKKLFARHHIIGYSFGAFIALHIKRQATCSLSLITPPLQEHDFSPLKQTSVPTALFLARHDDLIQSAEESCSFPHPVTTINDTDHFFRDKEEILARQVLQSLMGELMQ